MQSVLPCVEIGKFHANLLTVSNRFARIYPENLSRKFEGRGNWCIQQATCGPRDLLCSKSDSMTEFRAEVQQVCKNFCTTMAGCEYSAFPLIRRQEILPRPLRARYTAYSSASVAILAIYHRRDSPGSTRYQDTPHFPRPRINIGPSQRSKWKYARSNSDLRYWILFAGCHTLPYVLVRATSLLGEGFLTEGRNTLHALMRFH